MSSGSSWTDYGFELSGQQPTSADPIGNMDYKSRNQQSGPDYVVFLSTKYNDTSTLAYNFAMGGSCVNNAIYNCSVTPDLQQQVSNYFEPRYSTRNGTAYGDLWTSEDSIFIMWMGDNDVYNSATPNDGRDLTALGISLMESYFNDMVENLYQHGARNFMIVTIPAQDRSPRALALPSANQTNYYNFKQEYNSMLKSYSSAFQNKHNDIKHEFYNSSAFMYPILNNPTKYGFTDDTCQDKGTHTTKCMWNNDFHLVSAMHDLMAADMMPQLANLGF